MEVFKITGEERRALRATGYEELGCYLKDISAVFVNNSVEQLTDDYIDGLDGDALCIDDEYNDYKEHLETIIIMIERITGLDYTYTFVGSDASFERLNNTRIQ